jgi:hypothetical protein
MKDLQREIINQVATGKISAQEGTARLESLESAESLPGQAAVAESSPVAVPHAGTATRRVRVVSVMGSAEIVGDPSVAFAVAEGPHRARQDGDTMVIEQGPIGEDDHFSFSRSDRRSVIDSIDFGRRKIRVRMNPDLALALQVNAGVLRIEGVHGAISGEVLASQCIISGFASPLDLAIQAGNLSASGRLDAGVSKVRCEMGNVTINLEKGSSVRVSAHATMGKVAVESGGEPTNVGQSGREVVVGSGAGSLSIECTMGNVRVSS